jgi:hypothetical protein
MARVVSLPGRGYQVRWYDGRRNARGKLIETGGQVHARKPDATAEQRRVERTQRARKEAARANGARILSLPALLLLWRDWSAARNATRTGYRAEKARVLSALFEIREWRTVTDITQAAIEAWRASVNGVGTDKPLQWLKTLLRYALNVQRQPVDPGALGVPPRKRREKPMPVLLAQWEVDWLLALAQVRGGDGALAAFDHLATYGCRPIDVCRCDVGDFNPTAGEITYRDIKNHDTVTHPLLPRHVERYRAMTRGRAADEPFFLNPYGERWRISRAKTKSKSKEDRAEQMTSWYWTNVSRKLMAGNRRGLLCLKDYAISRMDALGIDDRTKALFTGHRTLAVFARYKGTNAQRARAALDRLV